MTYKKRKYRKSNYEITLAILFLGGFWLFLNKETAVTKLTLPIIYLISSGMFVGVVVYGFRIYKKRVIRNRYLGSGISIVDKMSGGEFEKFLLAHFESQGYKGGGTQKTNDYGADLILDKNGIKIVVQAKRYKGKIGISAVQEVLGAKGYYNSAKCLVVTNNYFTKQAVKLAEANNVELWDRESLIHLMESNSTKAIAEKTMNDVIDSNMCPECGYKLILRNGKNGQFVGCSAYPKCSYTKPC